MGKDKLRRFTEISTFKNVFELEEGRGLKGSWADKYFENQHPIILELGCGKGEYAVEMAKMFSENNFIGVDYKGNRIWRGAKTALEEGINNVAFLRIQIEDIAGYFDENEISEIWITFPDPQPQLSREKKRLTSTRFLEQYRALLQPGGSVHLKTDNDDFYAFTLKKIKESNLKLHISTNDVYHSEHINEVLSIKTYYEKKYLQNNKNINYLKFSFD